MDSNTTMVFGDKFEAMVLHAPSKALKSGLWALSIGVGTATIITSAFDSLFGSLVN